VQDKAKKLNEPEVVRGVSEPEQVF